MIYRYIIGLLILIVMGGFGLFLLRNSSFVKKSNILPTSQREQIDISPTVAATLYPSIPISPQTVNQIPESCPREYKGYTTTVDQVQGTIVKQSTTQSNSITLKVSWSPSPQSFPVTENVLEKVKPLSEGMSIRLFSYVESPESGATSPYSCVEF